MVLVLDFHPARLAVQGIVRELKALVELVPAYRKLLPVVTRLRFELTKSLKDVLVRAKLEPLQERVRGMFWCRKAKCKVCEFVEAGPLFMDKV